MPKGQKSIHYIAWITRGNWWINNAVYNEYFKEISGSIYSIYSRYINILYIYIIYRYRSKHICVYIYIYHAFLADNCIVYSEEYTGYMTPLNNWRPTHSGPWTATSRPSHCVHGQPAFFMLLLLHTHSGPERTPQPSVHRIMSSCLSLSSSLYLSLCLCRYFSQSMSLSFSFRLSPSLSLSEFLSVSLSPPLPLSLMSLTRPWAECANFINSFVSARHFCWIFPERFCKTMHAIPCCIFLFLISCSQFYTMSSFVYSYCCTTISKYINSSHLDISRSTAN